MTHSAQVLVPDIGDYKNVPVIEICVKAGDRIEKDATIVILESDKATLDVPAPRAGTVGALLVKVGDRVRAGAPILTLAGDDQPALPAAVAQGGKAAPQGAAEGSGGLTAASPSVRRLAREIGIDLTQITGSGPRNRILSDDIRKHVRETTAAVRDGSAAKGGTGFKFPPWPKVDFARFGRVERTTLSRIRRISGDNLSRNWALIPHVSNFEDADITDLEAFRVRTNTQEQKSGVKVTVLAFLVKAMVSALKRFPEFNASLDGDELVLKRYYHIGFAADTPNGLVVPVIRDADAKGILQIAAESAALSEQARAGKLSPADMQGACITISSLGGVGGTGFTPIINAPEVAILGVTRAEMQPVWDGSAFRPRFMLPLILSWDHRVVDGVAAARFLRYLADLLADFQKILL